MKYFILAVSIFFYSSLFSQVPAGTDIFLSDCILEKGNLMFKTPLNITHREGYDNQPYFSPDGTFIYYVAMKEDNQADIYSYSILQKVTRKFTHTKESEYSPRITPDGKNISVVRVEMDSSQLFQKYSLEDFSPSVICIGIDSIGYYNWVSDSNYVFFKVTQPPTLWLANSVTCSEKPLALNVGRCIYPINAHEIYFTQVIDSVKWICEMNLKTNKLTKVVACLKGSEDFSLTDPNTFIMGNGSKLYKFNTSKSKSWQEIADFQKQGVNNIKRLTFSTDKTKFAFVNDSGNP